MNDIINNIISDMELAENSISTPRNGRHKMMLDATNYHLLLDEHSQKKIVKDYIINARELLLSNLKEKHYNYIPKLTHKVWLTNENNPTPPSDRFIEIVSDFYSDFDSCYEHIIWVNSPEIKKILEKKINIDNLSVRLLAKQDNILYWKGVKFELSENIVNLIDDSKFAFACDHLRIELLYLFGGIYSDWGIRFRYPIQEYFNYFEYTFILGDGGFYQNSLMASNENSDLFYKLVKLLKTPKAMASQFLTSFNAETEGWLAAGPAITILLMLVTNKHTKVLTLLGNENSIKWAAQKSWYTVDGSRNNNSIVVKETSPSLI